MGVLSNPPSGGNYTIMGHRGKGVLSTEENVLVIFITRPKKGMGVGGGDRTLKIKSGIDRGVGTKKKKNGTEGRLGR